MSWSCGRRIVESGRQVATVDVSGLWMGEAVMRCCVLAIPRRFYLPLALRAPTRRIHTATALRTGWSTPSLLNI
jgi:hypothetical protein